MVLTSGIIGTAGARGNPTEIDEPVVIDEPGHYKLVDDINTSEDTAIIKIIADDITLEGNGHRIRSYGPGISADSVSDLTIQNLHIGGFVGIRATNTDSSLVENVDGGADARGIYFEGNENTFVDIRTGSALTDTGFLVVGSHNEVREADTYNTIGIEGDNNHIRRNTAGGFGITGIRVQGDGNRVRENSFRGAPDVCIDLYGTDNLVQRNTAELVAGTGIVVRDNANKIVNNEARGGGYGIRLNGDHNKVIRNDVRDNREGIENNGENNLLRANRTDSQGGANRPPHGNGRR
ncbi:NosD domain-containing protein [Natronomonas amylolytica]|uniref:NosD domain-containing protein n=1 Tax=Natronomonas amylolytica TaxID=3108498 RepID=UPI00300824B9